MVGAPPRAVNPSPRARDGLERNPTRFRRRTQLHAARQAVEAVDLPTVAALLGHSRLDTVRVYSQPDAAALERAADALEAR
jgi:hypothetical protein